jgi:uncharacterized protein YbcV (DUF1398 family)
MKATMNTEVLRNTLHESEAGKLTFPQVVAALTGAGVESYFVDLARRVDTFYMSNGETYAEKMSSPAANIAQDFSDSGLLSAIRAAQADQIRYPEFLQRATAAGTIAYWVFIAGKKAIYFGRKGESHVEDFPRPKA